MQKVIAVKVSNERPEQRVITVKVTNEKHPKRCL